MLAVTVLLSVLPLNIIIQSCRVLWSTALSGYFSHIENRPDCSGRLVLRQLFFFLELLELQNTLYGFREGFAQCNVTDVGCCQFTFLNGST